MADFSSYRRSKNLLERAAYYAVTASWVDSSDFDQAQEDAHKLLALSKINWEASLSVSKQEVSDG